MQASDRRRAIALLLTFILGAAWAGTGIAGELSDARAQERMALKSLIYQADMGRDPFSLPDFAAEARSADADMLEITMSRLVGVVDTGRELIALVEDLNGESYTLRRNDRVRGGRVTELGMESLVAWVQINGVSQRIQLRLGKEGE